MRPALQWALTPIPANRPSGIEPLMVLPFPLASYANVNS
jgi:hypothetical protein